LFFISIQFRRRVLWQVLQVLYCIRQEEQALLQVFRYLHLLLLRPEFCILLQLSQNQDVYLIQGLHNPILYKPYFKE
jgi:hypothetical protein